MSGLCFSDGPSKGAAAPRLGFTPADPPDTSFCQSLCHRFSLLDTFALCTCRGRIFTLHCTSSAAFCFPTIRNYKELEGGSLYVL